MHYLLSIYFNISASTLLLLYRYITVHGLQNIKKRINRLSGLREILCWSALQKK